MCTTRSWKSFVTSQDDEVVIAKRSDNKLFQFFSLEFNTIGGFIRKLEEFRNCQCSPETPCPKHIEEKERINA